MHPDTLAQIAFDRHHERTQLAHRVPADAYPSTRTRVATAMRRVADRLGAGRPPALIAGRP